MQMPRRLRPFGMRRSWVLAVVVLLLMTIAVPVGAKPKPDVPAQAGTPHTCGVGEVQSAFQAFRVGFKLLLTGTASSESGVVGGVAKCQYRVFLADRPDLLGGGRWTFREGEPFLGGVVYFEPYKALGISRGEAIAEMDEYVDRVWLDGVEQDLMSTAYKNVVVDPEVGPIVYQSRGFITELEAGTYESYWETTVDGVVVFSATVPIDVIP